MKEKEEEQFWRWLTGREEFGQEQKTVFVLIAVALEKGWPSLALRLSQDVNIHEFRIRQTADRWGQRCCFLPISAWCGGGIACEKTCTVYSYTLQRKHFSMESNFPAHSQTPLHHPGR
jgi:hypothetical protein